MKGMPPKLYSRLKFVQIFFPDRRWQHLQVVDDGAVDAQPAEQIVVLLIQGAYFASITAPSLRLRGDGGFRESARWTGSPAWSPRWQRWPWRFPPPFPESLRKSHGLCPYGSGWHHRDQRDAEHCHEDDEEGLGPLSSPSALPGVIAAGRDGGAVSGICLPVCHVSSLNMGCSRASAEKGRRRESRHRPRSTVYVVFFNSVFSCGRRRRQQPRRRRRTSERCPESWRSHRCRSWERCPCRSWTSTGRHR